MNPQVKHPHLFIEDGNIVITASSIDVNKFGAGDDGATSGSGDVGMQVEAQPPRGTVLFCVHKSMLARQSQVFGNMLNIAAGDLGETFEGRPTVTLPDPAEDVEALLNAIYNPTELPFRRHDPYTSVRVHRALHMATKYQCESIRSRIVEHIKQDWPTNLDDLEYSEREVRELMHKTSSDIDLLLPEPAAAYRLGKLFDIPEILPATFYILTTLKTYEDFDAHHSAAYKNHDGTIDDAHPIGSRDRTARFTLLDVHDYRALYRWREFISDFKIERNQDYEVLDSCYTSCEDVMDKLWESKKEKLRSTMDVLWNCLDTTEVNKALSSPNHEEAFCEGCATNFINDLHATKLRIWEEIVRLANSG